MRLRLYPTPAQTLILLRHCADARYVWNLALEQWNWHPWVPGLRAPSFLEQSRHLTELRAAEPWVAEGSRMVQTQALRDFDQAKRNFYGGTHGRPTWRRKGIHEGFRIVDRPTAWDVSRLNRRWAVVQIPKAGWVRFRMSRPVPDDAKSYRVTFKAGQWHVAFHPCVPASIPGPGDGSMLGIDRGVAIPFACSDGTSYSLPKEDAAKLRRLQRHLARQKKGSGRRNRTKAQIAKLRFSEVCSRRDAIEKATTDLARRCDFFRIEDLSVANMTRSARGTVGNPGRNVRAKAGLNRTVRSKGWATFATRLEEKAPCRVEKVKPHFTSQRCPYCQHVSPENRKSQATFRCVVCSFSGNADWVAAMNIAAGHAVTARGGWSHQGPPTNREPQPQGWNLLALGEDVKRFATCSGMRKNS